METTNLQGSIVSSSEQEEKKVSAEPQKILAGFRVNRPNREQIDTRPQSLDALLPEGHRARLVWDFVERQDLSGFYAGIKVREGGPGRTAIAPEILFALWLYGTVEGVGSARELARLTEEHDAYRWICGGVQVNYHTLADFRVDHEKLLDDLLTSNLASLLAVGAVKLNRVAQDGMRVRASAGAASFRRGKTLEDHLRVASEQVTRLKTVLHRDLPSPSKRSQAARERAARERKQRVERALERLPEIEEAKRRQGKPAEKARVSTTDPEATVMKMADGGFRPAYNTQFATDTESQIIVGVAVITSGSDQGQLTPMVKQVNERCGITPGSWLVDGGYPSHDQIDAVSEQTVVYAPVPASKKADIDPHVPKKGDSESVAKWRERMGTEEAKVIYKERAATAECVNAQTRQRGLTCLRVRGRCKARSIALWYTLAHNLMRMVSLVPEWFGEGVVASRVPVIAI